MSGPASLSQAPAQPPPDPTKHVNYTNGMVLGVDDFVQEFAYLAERDQWAVRDLVGYGTSWGLAVTRRLGTRGPEIAVSPGVAVSPRGRLIRVTPLQCAPLNAWLARNAAEIGRRIAGPALDAEITLHVVLTYRECETDLLPIPGEPCRSESETRAPSRLTDDFRLELRFEPPDQREDDALRDFARWLATHVEVAQSSSSFSSSSIPLDDFLAALRAAVVSQSPPSDVSPPGSPLDFLIDGSPAAPLSIDPADLPRYLGAAYRLWVTELRPAWRPSYLGAAQGCASPVTPPLVNDADSVLLASARVGLVRELDGGDWKVASESDVVIDDSQRPYLLSLRLLQELVLAGPAAGGAAAAAGAAFGAAFAPAGPRVVAAGHIRGDGVALAPPFGGLRVAAIAPGRLVLGFPGFVAPTPTSGHQYVVKALSGPGAAATDPSPSVRFGGFDDGTAGGPPGVVLHVLKGSANVPVARLALIPLMVEVTEYPTPL